MPWTLNNPPDVAKNWSKAQKQRCVSAANSVIRSGKSDREAIFACIHAAGKGKQKQGPDDYEQASEEASGRFQDLLKAYIAGRITLSLLRRQFRDELEQHFVTLMILGLAGKTPTETDYARLEQFIEREMTYFNGFMLDLERGRITPDRAVWRAGLYGFTRHVYVNYTVPDFVALGMPVLPGEDCLGGDLCGCSLEITSEDDEFVYVNWVLNPAKESCEVCIGHAIDSPYQIAKP